MFYPYLKIALITALHLKSRLLLRKLKNRILGVPITFFTVEDFFISSNPTPQPAHLSLLISLLIMQYNE